MATRSGGAGRQERQRKRNRRRRIAGMIYRLILLALIATAAVFAITIFFQISTVEVKGDSRYTDEEIRQALGIEPGDNLFFLDKFQAIDRLFDQLVYLDEVNIHRQLPDTLVVEVKDCAPVSALEVDGVYYLLDRKGKLLEPTTAEIAQGHVMIYGVDAQGLEPGDRITQAENGQIALDLLAVMEDNGILSKIDYVDVTHSYDLLLGYNQQFQVQIGSAEDLERKARFLVSVVERLTPGDMGIIDLKSNEKEARFRPLTELPQPGTSSDDGENDTQASEQEGQAQEETTQSGGNP